MSHSNLRIQVQELCKKISPNRLIIQGAGGNVSWKDDLYLWIKRSGTWLSAANNKNIFTPLLLSDLCDLIKKDQFSLTENMIQSAKGRPSIEVMVHALIKDKFVFHLHMPHVVAKLINDPKGLLLNLFQNGLNARIISYKKPGDELAIAVKKTLNDYPNTQILLLMNHGVIIYSDYIDVIEYHIKLLNNICEIPCRRVLPNPLQQPTVDNIDNEYKLLSDKTLSELVTDDWFDYLESLWAIGPDHIVFLGPYPYTFDSIDNFYKNFKKNNKALLIFVKNNAIYIHKKLFLNIHLIQLYFFYDVITRLKDIKNVPVISKEEVMKLINWEAEKYRMETNITRNC